ncbi:hypothetical protein LT493_06145 [Streptomyces tricolor]|nr:hypothetical protein [Streptomyces tricolor]
MYDRTGSAATATAESTSAAARCGRSSAQPDAACQRPRGSGKHTAGVPDRRLRPAGPTTSPRSC